MKPLVFALLLFFVPASLAAQNPGNPQQRSSGKKLRWLGIAAVAGGIGVAALGGKSEKETIVQLPTTTSTVSIVTAGTATSATAASIAAVVPIATSGAGTSPLAPPGGGPGSTPGGPLAPPTDRGAGSVASTPSTTRVERFNLRNWKVIGPALGVAGAGAFLTYVGHVRVKRAELSIKPTGAVQLAFKW